MPESERKVTQIRLAAYQTKQQHYNKGDYRE